VVVGCVDPFSEVSGRGIRKLRDAGINVTVGVLEKECLALNRRFIINHTEKRPYVILKWAQSSDGFIDRHRSSSDEPPVVFSNAHTSMLVHRQRAGVQAIMVGRRTALLDNPSLTVRRWPGESPLRVVLDRELSLPETLHLFDGTVPTLVFTAHTNYPHREGVEYVTLDFAQPVIPQVLTELYARRIQSILVEGGSTLIQGFIQAQAWDEVHIEIAPITLGDGVKAPTLPEGLNKDTIQIGTHRKEIFIRE
jgi:diaminohydroxyphosphoribosylaminopyrimidine deaminase/5-amino-6-(5-phosphoribosylamino)uracil reductase